MLGVRCHVPARAAGGFGAAGTRATTVCSTTGPFFSDRVAAPDDGCADGELVLSGCQPGGDEVAVVLGEAIRHVPLRPEHLLRVDQELHLHPRRLRHPWIATQAIRCGSTVRPSRLEVSTNGAAAAAPPTEANRMIALATATANKTAIPLRTQVAPCAGRPILRLMTWRVQTRCQETHTFRPRVRS